jgi:hypothetical protein
MVGTSGTILAASSARKTGAVGDQPRYGNQRSGAKSNRTEPHHGIQQESGTAQRRPRKVSLSGKVHAPGTLSSDSAPQPSHPTRAPLRGTHCGCEFRRCQTHFEIRRHKRLTAGEKYHVHIFSSCPRGCDEGVDAGLDLSQLIRNPFSKSARSKSGLNLNDAIGKRNCASVFSDKSHFTF